MTALQFVKATKKRSKARIALDGPSGSGKTYSALIAASVLAEGGRIAVIDTERGSASLYSDKFNFDVLELNTFSPKQYIEAIEAAEQAGYSVVVIDSLSHAWEGEGGALEMVDAAAARSQSKNTYFAWRDVTPLHRKLVDAMLQSTCHIIATMRSKTEYIIETNSKGGQVPRKIGMAPIQRAGMEYEFTIVGDLDIDHKLVISKSRCEALADKVETKPGAPFWQVFLNWLNSGGDAPPPTVPAPVKVQAPQPPPVVHPNGNGSGAKTWQPAGSSQAPVAFSPNSWRTFCAIIGANESVVTAALGTLRVSEWLTQESHRSPDGAAALVAMEVWRRLFVQAREDGRDDVQPFQGVPTLDQLLAGIKSLEAQPEPPHA